MAGEVRAEMARRQVSQSALAGRMGKPQPWLSRRIGAGANTDITLDEVAGMAQALGVSTEGLLLYAIRDSNPEPADMEDSPLTSGLVVDLVAYRAERAA